MSSNSHPDGEDGDSPHHAIQIWEVNQDRLSLMHRKIAATPGILSKSAGRSSCCIFRVPKSLKDINGEHYQPQMLSIGPYYHGKPQLVMIEEHKWRFLGILLKRTEAKGLKLEDYLKAIRPLESQARYCYSESITFNPDEFVEMLVVDGCFIIELFRKIGGILEIDSDDPLFAMSWVYSFFLRDLIHLENQIPFFILQTLFELTRMPDDNPVCSLAYLTLKFFDNAIQRSEEFIENYSTVEGKHILDFLRSSFIPPGFAELKPGKFSVPSLVPCITNLSSAGISIRPGEAESFLAITFKGGVLEMPTIALDDFMSSFLLNCVAYEQCHGASSKHLTTYIMLIDCLINTSRDVMFLCDRNIIENYFGTDGEVAKFVNNMGKIVVLDLDLCYLAGLFDEVNHYYNSNWYVANLMTPYITYFSTPWSFTAALFAFVILVLTTLQTIYTMLGYVRGQ